MENGQDFMAARLFFCQTQRKLPSLNRGWRTPDPSPTRDAAGLPGCALRLCIAEPCVDEYPVVRQGRRNMVGIPLTSRTPSPSPARPQPATPQSWSKLGMQRTVNEDNVSTPRMQWPQTIGSNFKVKDQVPQVQFDASPSGAPLAKAPIRKEMELEGVTKGEASKSKPAEICSEAGPIVSAGSVGHPYTCAEPCKYVRKKHRGCKDGSACVRCHLCEWKRRNYTDKGEKGNTGKGGGQGEITTDTAVQPEADGFQ